MTLACDGKSALNQCFQSHTLAPSARQFDAISTVRAMLNDSVILFVPRHVKGHQDIKSNSPLTWWELLPNLEVDVLAVLFRKSLTADAAANPPQSKVLQRTGSSFLEQYQTVFLEPGENSGIGCSAKTLEALGQIWQHFCCRRERN